MAAGFAVVSEILNALFVTIVTCAAAWLVIIGGIGAIIAVRRGRRAVFGFAVSIVLPPVLGWLVVVILTRSPDGRIRTSTNDGPDDEDPFLRLLED